MISSQSVQRRSFVTLHVVALTLSSIHPQLVLRTSFASCSQLRLFGVVDHPNVCPCLWQESRTSWRHRKNMHNNLQISPRHGQVLFIVASQILFCSILTNKKQQTSILTQSVAGMAFWQLISGFHVQRHDTRQSVWSQMRSCRVLWYDTEADAVLRRMWGQAW